MDKPNLTLAMTAFSDKVKAMNQMRQPELRLTAVEASNLLSDMFSVLAQVSRLEAELDRSSTNIAEVVMDGGGFK
jgi:hypothetical protein